MNRKTIAFPSLFLLLWLTAGPVFGQSAPTGGVALRNLQRAIVLLDSAMTRSLRGTPDNLYMADVVDLESGEASGPSDVWPYTAAIEAHCSVLEALDALRTAHPRLYDSHRVRLAHRLEVLIDNLDYYRGTYTLPSYASRREWSVHAVPRARERGRADVAGDGFKKNVYDDQMWLMRELVRAYRLTGNEAHLQVALHLADYVTDGWDCWRDAAGQEYGGITWGPGYNSKHACSNAPVIQPLVWLYEICHTPDEKADYPYWHRDGENRPVVDSLRRSDLYLNFARKIYDWQKRHLLDTRTGVYHDMLGADNTLRYEGQGDALRRRHVPTGRPTGRAYAYNTGTMLAGGLELFRTTEMESYRKDVLAMAEDSYEYFSTPQTVEGKVYHQWPTDADALHGFNAWFVNVLMRAHAEVALSLPEETAARRLLDSFQQNLDYAFEHHLHKGHLPIDLLGGWGTAPDRYKTKPFHQCAFAAEYAMLSLSLTLPSREGMAPSTPPEGELRDASAFLSPLPRGS